MKKLLLCLFCISTFAYGVDSFSVEDHIFRAEHYVVSGQFEDLEKVHELEQKILVDLLISYTCLGDHEKAFAASVHLENLLNAGDSQVPSCPCKDENFVSGPDKEPGPGWCEQTVDVTTRSLLQLVEKTKFSQTTKDSICYCLEQLRNSGLKCCGRKEPWKGCVGPLAKRMVQWDAYGVPEDPRWD